MFSLHNEYIIMIRSCANCLVLAAVFQVILSYEEEYDTSKIIPRDAHDLGMFHPLQDLIPRHCWHPPHEADLHKCCPRPHLYSDEVLDLCGIQPAPKDPSVYEPKHIYNTKPCENGICLMKHANLLFANESVDYEKLGTYVDAWAAANPDFSDTILAAKPVCAREKDESWKRGVPPDICDQDRVFLCFRSRMLWNCKIKDLRECDSLRQNIKECKPHYENPRKYAKKSII